MFNLPFLKEAPQSRKFAGCRRTPYFNLIFLKWAENQAKDEVALIWLYDVIRQVNENKCLLEIL
jgi:hypothetical protein